MINFNDIETSILPHFKGGEGEMHAEIYADDLNKILRVRLPRGCTIGQHTHDTSSEIIFIISGIGKSILDGKEETLTPGICHYCPKGSSHCMINTGDEDLVFYAVVPQQ